MDRKYPYDKIPLSTDVRLLWVAEPRLSVNRMISGTRAYARTLLNGSHIACFLTASLGPQYPWFIFAGLLWTTGLYTAMTP